LYFIYHLLLFSIEVATQADFSSFFPSLHKKWENHVAKVNKYFEIQNFFTKKYLYDIYFILVINTFDNQ